METNYMFRLIKRFYIMAEQYHRKTWILTPSQSLFMEYLEDCLQKMIRNLEQENERSREYEDVKNIAGTAKRI